MFLLLLFMLAVLYIKSFECLRQTIFVSTNYCVNNFLCYSCLTICMHTYIVHTCTYMELSQYITIIRGGEFIKYCFLCVVGVRPITIIKYKTTFNTKLNILCVYIYSMYLIIFIYSFIICCFQIGQVNVTNQTFIEMTELPFSYALSHADAIVGLAFPESSPGITTVFLNLLRQRTIKKSVFSIYMNR